MKFNKKVLTEELGVPKSNKKTFTKDAKQKIVMTEEQLNRLLGVMTEDSSWEESLHYGEDMGQDDEELYDLKHDDGGHVHIKDLEDDIHYDHDHDDGVEGELGEGKKKTFSTQDDVPKSKGKSAAQCDNNCNPNQLFGCPPCGVIGGGKSDGGRPKGQMGESSRLKTTQTINESEINKMRTMFNRMNTTGKNYNPSRS
tara:strand:- start:16719 stop:17312 length:594 start_codon:yes stop_codon:yes gene_type:complete